MTELVGGNLTFINIPKGSGKTDLKELTSVPKFNFDGELVADQEKALYSFEVDGFIYDFLVVRKPKPTGKLFVLLSGAAVGVHLSPPVFQRWKWAEYFPGDCLYISDPTLRLEAEFKLAWYAGNANHEPLDVVAKLIKLVAGQLHVSLKDVFCYGSSGGGFAALRLGARMNDIGIVAVNPQTDITKYEQGSVEKFLRICFNGISRDEALEQYPEKMSVARFPERLIDSRIIYVQNDLDEHHVSVHQGPFRSAMESAGPGAGNILWLNFSNAGGHSAAESPEVFTKIINTITDDGY